MSLTTSILLASVLTFVVFNIFPVYKFTSSNQDAMLYHAYKIKLEPYGTTVSSSGEAVDELLCKHVELCQVDVVALHLVIGKFKKKIKMINRCD